jgi:hypothetical protein
MAHQALAPIDILTSRDGFGLTKKRVGERVIGPAGWRAEKKAAHQA